MPIDALVNPLPNELTGTATYYDLSVTYSQPTNLIMFPGPTMTLSRRKRVWISGNGTST